MARLPVAESSKQVLAFLDMIAWSEIGPKLLEESDDGYDVIVGSTPAHPDLMQTYFDHPRKLVRVSATLKSTAAGRYQFLRRTWDNLVQDHHYDDFSPPNQDRGCIQLIREAGALGDITTGRTESAIERCARIWASLPGAGYGQRENRLGHLLAAYSQALLSYV